MRSEHPAPLKRAAAERVTRVHSLAISGAPLDFWELCRSVYPVIKRNQKGLGGLGFQEAIMERTTDIRWPRREWPGLGLLN